MGGFSGIWQWALIAVVVLLLFGGRGKLSGLMGDAAKGIRAFKKGLKDTDSADTPIAEDPPKNLESEAKTVVTEARETDEAAKS